MGFFFKYKQLVSEASDTEYRYVMERLSGTADISGEEAAQMFKTIYRNQTLRLSYNEELDVDLDGFHETMKILSERLNFKYERAKK